MRRILVIAVLAVLGYGPARAETVKEGIEAANQKFEAAFNKGDAAGVAQLYTADGALLPPGEARIDGRDAIQSYWKGAIDAGFKNITLQSVEVTASGDNAAEVGKWTIMGPTAKSEVQTMSGKYVVLWSHADGGSWQLHRDLWNDDPAGQD